MTSAYRIRPATPADTEAISAVLLEAGLQAWASFLGAERIEAANRGRQHPADLVAVDDEGVFAFVAGMQAIRARSSASSHIPEVSVAAPAERC